MRDLSRLTPEERAWFEEIKDEEPALRDVHEIRPACGHLPVFQGF
jgi:hypothetical protein